MISAKLGIKPKIISFINIIEEKYYLPLSELQALIDWMIAPYFHRHSILHIVLLAYAVEMAVR
jgi:hypothetical protein